jgi:Zn-dependent protease with chaperone function
VLLLPLALLWALLPNDGIALVANWFADKVVAVMVELPFSRDMEVEADQVGMLMAAKVRRIPTI